MAVKIPEVQVYKTFSKANIKRAFQPRRIITAMASDGFLPVIALEAFVEAGRTYQAYKRGGFDEARERITEEFSGAVFWLGGVTGLNWLFEQLGKKFLGLPFGLKGKTVDIGSDAVRDPLGNYLAEQTLKNGKKISPKMFSVFKFGKVIASVLIANAFIGFVLPKINQGITRWYHRNQKPQQNKNQNTDSFMPRPKMEDLTQRKDKDVSFGMNLFKVAHMLENDRTCRLLSVDVGTASGRVYSARNNDERYEIGFRDISSVYFYMFNMPNMNKWLNKLEQKGINSRLDPTSAQFATEYMQNYVGSRSVNIETFAKDMLGENKQMPEAIKELFKDGEVVKLSDLKAKLKEVLPQSEYAKFEELAQKMSELQPKRIFSSPLKNGNSTKISEYIITKSQVEDIFRGGYINDPEFLKAFYKNILGDKFLNKYRYVPQKELDGMKSDLINYVKSIIEAASKTKAKEVTAEILKNSSKHNFKMNALNWGAGFATSALFLSTIIPKMQYMITKLRTGKDGFPGTEQYRQAA